MSALADDQENNSDIILLGKYKIKSKHSQGGFGKIYKCKDMTTGNICIAKINSDKKMNENEFMIAKDMSGTKGFPMIYDKGFLDG